MTAPAVATLPRRCHLVGMGGIGMSGLAQLLRGLGHEVSGSDRAMAAPENARLMADLERQGIRLFPQDGSAAVAGIDCLIHSTAIEPDNPDFLAAPELPHWHRSAALAAACGELADLTTVAVTGSCGKTTVTAWLAAALVNLGQDPMMLCGGMAIESRRGPWPGNYRPGRGLFIFEADESDKSLLAYAPDYAMVLNLGTDHYPRAELVTVFRQFLGQTRRGAVLGGDVASALGAEPVPGLACRSFGLAATPPPSLPGSLPHLTVAYCRDPQLGPTAQFADGPLSLPAPGRHNALNAAAVRAMLEMLGHAPAAATLAVGSFPGVHRRFEEHGRTATGARVFDDYAHNVEKIVAALRLAQEMVPGRVWAVFQPHGFGPLGFMREPLLQALEETLRDGDAFLFLPVFYAGGSTSFSPTSAAVAADFRQRGTRDYRHAADRTVAAAMLGELGAGEAALVLGARDNSLAGWAEQLAGLSEKSG